MVYPVQGIALGWLESRVTNNAAQFFFRGAVGHSGSPDNIFFQHHRSHVVATKAQAHLADFQSLGYPTGLNIQEVREVQPGNGQYFQVFDRSGLIPVASAQRRVLWLEAPRDKRSEAAGLFLQLVKPLEVIHPVFDVLAYAEHHGRGRAHAQLVGGAMHVKPVLGQALEPGYLVADFVVENFGAASGDGIQSGIAQTHNSVADAQLAVFRYGNNLRRRVAVQMNFRKALLDAAEHLFMPVDLQIGVQAALHEDSGAAQFNGFPDLVVDGFKLEDVSLFGRGPFQRPVERTEGAILGAEIRVINVAINDVGSYALGMKLAAYRVSLHADADKVVGTEQVQSLLFGE